jgi:signal transduction histidine kinase
VQTNQGTNSENDFRLLIVTPTGRDAALIRDLLVRTGVSCKICATCATACLELAIGAGALIVAEESLTEQSINLFTRVIADQPPWSDFPLMVLTAAGRVSVFSQRRSEMREPLGNVLLLERPVRPESLISTVQSALRARGRQYQVRDSLRRSRQADEALRQSEKLAVAGRLAASIAHEINNPLTAVTNLLYLISTAKSLDQVKSYADIAQQELSRVSEIAIQTLKFYRQPSNPARVQLNEVLDSVLSLYHARLTAAGIRVDKRYGAAQAITGFGGELRQLFANLISNSVDAMRSGGQLKIRVKDAIEFSNGARSGVRILIADSGSGIPVDIKNTMFDAFVTTKGTTGTGLGLWVSSGIIQKHGGKVRVKSSTVPGKSGTVFSIFLPAGHVTPRV